MRLGVIADDFTGATDIAGFLVRNGLRTIQLNGLPAMDDCVDTDAVVISLKTRSCPAAQAVDESLAALRWLRARHCRQFFFKYCSTFDSTAQGNIGPVTDALLAELDEHFTVVCPALPVNGRTIYHGYLFVNGVMLHESGMQHHPVTPMTDSNIMRMMEAQACGRAGNIAAATIEQGDQAVRAALAQLRTAGIRYAVLDALNERHMEIIGRAVADVKLVTGGSGLADGMTRTLAPVDVAAAEAAGRPVDRGYAVVLSGSCSQMTNAQVAAYRQKAASRAVDVRRCIEDDHYVKELGDWVVMEAGRQWPPLVYATMPPADLQKVQKQFGVDISSRAVERMFGRLARHLQARGFTRFIVAGGETSGSVTKALDIRGFAIGPQITPGVPWVRARGLPLSLALKSGNFGLDTFFADAVESAACGGDT